MKKQTKLIVRILAVAMLAAMLAALISCGGNKDNPAEPKGSTESKTEDTTSPAEEQTTKAPQKERDVPYQDKTEDDTVNDEF